MNHVLRIVTLVAALAVALAACAPADKAIGPEVTGTVVGYDGPEAPIVVYALDPASDETHELGSGTVDGSTIRFTLKPAPEATLAAVVDPHVETSDPELRTAIAFVLLADESGEFQLAKLADPSATEPTAGDAIAMLMYADRAATITVVGEGTYLHNSSLAMRKGWNVVVQTFAPSDEADGPFLRLSAGNIGDYDWYYEEFDPAP